MYQIIVQALKWFYCTLKKIFFFAIVPMCVIITKPPTILLFYIYTIKIKEIKQK